MKVAFYSMMKNELSLSVAFSEMLYEFGDYIYILDHASTDNTVSSIKQNVPDAKVFHLRSRRYPQSEMSNFFARKIFNETDADFLFFLDADEFLPFATKDEMIEFLSEMQDYDAIAFPWNNLAPSGTSFDDGFYSMGNSQNYYKIALNRRITLTPDYNVCQGNHGVTSRKREVAICLQRTKPLFHLPVPSYTKFIFKILQGIDSLRNDKLNNALGNGYHWFQLADKVCSGNLTDLEIRSLIYSYSGSIPEVMSEHFEPFSFPYIKSRMLRETPVNDILRWLLGSYSANLPENHAGKQVDITVEDDAGRVILTAKQQYIRDIAMIAKKQIRSKVPKSARDLIKRIGRRSQ